MIKHMEHIFDNMLQSIRPILGVKIMAVTFLHHLADQLSYNATGIQIEYKPSILCARIAGRCHVYYIW